MSDFTFPAWADTPECRTALANIAAAPDSVRQFGSDGCWLHCLGENVDPIRAAWNALFEQPYCSDELVALGADIRPDELVCRTIDRARRDAALVPTKVVPLEGGAYRVLPVERRAA